MISPIGLMYKKLTFINFLENCPRRFLKYSSTSRGTPRAIYCDPQIPDPDHNVLSHLTLSIILLQIVCDDTNNVNEHDILFMKNLIVIITDFKI